MTIGDFIKRRRTELGLTLEEIGKATGVGKSTVKKWETGSISNMRRDRIEQLAKILQVNPVIFIENDIADYDQAINRTRRVTTNNISYRILALMKYKKLSFYDLSNYLSVDIDGLRNFILYSTDDEKFNDPRLIGIANALGLKSVELLTGYGLNIDEDTDSYIKYIFQKIDEDLPLTQNEQLTLEDFLFENDNFSYIAVQIPVLGYVKAGIPMTAVENIIDYEEISQEQARTGEFFGLQIKGDSMEPKISEGDVVIVRKQETVENGEIAVVLINGDDATVKKFYKTDAGIKLVSTNPTYDPFFYTPDEVNALPVIVIGKVVELRAKF